jgi:hypothetical protein
MTPMGEARRRREANVFDHEGLLTRLAGIDLPLEDRRERACLTETFRDFAAMAMHADGGAGLIGSREQAAANIAAHCVVAESVGYGARAAYLTSTGPAWGGHVVFANPPPVDAIGPPSPEQIMRRVLMQVSGFAGEMAAKLWRPGSCADDMVVSTAQTQVLAAALGAPDRIIALRMKLWSDLVALLGDEGFGRERKAIEAVLVGRRRIEGDELAGLLAPLSALRRGHGDLASMLTAALRGDGLKGAPSDDEMLKEIGATVPRGWWREMRGGGREH